MMSVDKSRAMPANSQIALNSDDIIILDDDAEDDNSINKTTSKQIEPVQKKAKKINTTKSLNGEQTSNKKRGFCANTRCKSNNKGVLKYCPSDILRFYKINVDKSADQLLCDGCFEKATKEIGVNILCFIYQHNYFHDLFTLTLYLVVGSSRHVI